MRGGVCFLVLCLAAEPAVAQSVEALAGKAAKDIEAINDRVAYWRTTCLKDWDAATRMTPKERRTTYWRAWGAGNQWSARYA
jgi:hypothetical protein